LLYNFIDEHVGVNSRITFPSRANKEINIINENIEEIIQTNLNSCFEL
jgi:hypothetical protein